MDGADNNNRPVPPAHTQGLPSEVAASVGELLALGAELDAQAKELESCAQEYLDHGLLAQSRDARTMAQDIRSQLSSLRASQGLRTEYARFDTALPQPDHRNALGSRGTKNHTDEALERRAYCARGWKVTWGLPCFGRGASAAAAAPRAVRPSDCDVWGGRDPLHSLVSSSIPPPSPPEEREREQSDEAGCRASEATVSSQTTPPGAPRSLPRTKCSICERTRC